MFLTNRIYAKLEFYVQSCDFVSNFAFTSVSNSVSLCPILRSILRLSVQFCVSVSNSVSLCPVDQIFSALFRNTRISAMVRQ